MHHQHPELPMGGDLALLFCASVLGSAHCVAMCGPYVTMCTAQFVPGNATAAARCGLRALFNLGRIATYCLIGLIVGAFGQIAQALASHFGVAGIVAILTGIAALLFGLSMIGLLRDPTRVFVAAGVGRWIVAGRAHLRHASTGAAPLLLGALQGCFPCALVYAAASRASLTGSPAMGAITMLIFGLGTVPAIFTLTMIPRALLRQIKTQRLAGVLLAVLGMLLILRGLANFGLVPSTGWW
jgi:sulfite exporter TauE/SafE